jgi:hypothetical protein
LICPPEATKQGQRIFERVIKKGPGLRLTTRQRSRVLRRTELDEGLRDKKF